MNGAVLLALVLVTVVAGSLAVAAVVPYLALTRRARHDYEAARGTHHRRQLEAALAAIRRQRERLRAEGEQRRRQHAEWDAAERAELERALATHLVDARLDEVAGVGPAPELLEVLRPLAPDTATGPAGRPRNV